MNYRQKEPALLEAKKKSISSDDFISNITADMRDNLIKNVLSKHKNWRKASGEERKEIIAEIAEFFSDNYPQVFKKKSTPILQRLAQKLKGLKLKKQVQESVEEQLQQFRDLGTLNIAYMKPGSTVVDLERIVDELIEDTQKDIEAWEVWQKDLRLHLNT